MKELKKLIEATNVLNTVEMTQIKGGARDIRSTQTTTAATTNGSIVKK